MVAYFHGMEGVESSSLFWSTKVVLAYQIIFKPELVNFVKAASLVIK